MIPAYEIPDQDRDLWDCGVNISLERPDSAEPLTRAAKNLQIQNRVETFMKAAGEPVTQAELVRGGALSKYQMDRGFMHLLLHRGVVRRVRQKWELA